MRRWMMGMMRPLVSWRRACSCCSNAARSRTRLPPISLLESRRCFALSFSLVSAPEHKSESVHDKD